MGKTRGRPSSRSRIVTAAEDLVRCEGAARLSLDAVAERAEISKGGLLYNFPTKCELLRAMIGEYVQRMTQECADARARIGEAGPNAHARAHVAASDAICQKEGPPPAGLLAVIAEQPELLDPLRDYYRGLFEKIAGDRDPDLSLIAFLAVEGMCSLELFDTYPLRPSSGSGSPPCWRRCWRARRSPPRDTPASASFQPLLAPRLPRRRNSTRIASAGCR
ncbi:TetR/AcrR family transcriptional regulator [Methylobrevis pamukkalensis]|uniref:Bacterial regulatory protein, tetR family n=1 Tax=Methylobrevis pamukkalensis TaxID=1439726 RepID=A0A1E3H7U0_9HYPH|nr:TetR/AcrR family transcriptional regulator [Methylobrevis pamukkalensis]ODN72374.1 Bacterial regulatory protein, tetR family [Methylobrevis pamukkalensis]